MLPKILMFGWEFPPFNSGGLGTACFGLTKALSLKGASITFILPSTVEVSSENIKFLFADSAYKNSNLTVKHIQSPILPYMGEADYFNVLSSSDKIIYGKNLLDEVSRYGKEAVEVVKGVDFDIIHAHDWMSIKAGILAKEIYHKPLIVHIHSTEIDRTGGDKNINQEVFNIEKEGMEKADEVIVVSDFTKQTIKRNYGIPEGKIHVVHNGIDIDEFRNEAEEEYQKISSLKQAGGKIVLFVGRLTIQKGADYFIKAAKKVLEYNSRVLFVIAGSGDMERSIIEQTASYGISDKVLFAGFIRGSELKSLYKMADLFVMPSVSEPFGITTLESVASGVPVILSKQSGVKEVMPHALVVDFWDTEEMANKILAVINYESLSMSLSSNALDRVKDVNWDNAAKKCIEVYKGVLNNYFGYSA